MDESSGTDRERPVSFNNNSYLSIGIVVLLVAATIWIKDGQSSVSADNRLTATELAHYKELQSKDAQILTTKIDALTELVKLSNQDRFTGKDAKRAWLEFQKLNPELHLVLPDI